jgi:RNA polymerase subunit RPABC4/transcription elongation factor Spt4
MGAPAVFGIDNGGLNLFVNLLIVCMVAVWFATIYWVYADARRRMEDPMLITCAWVGALFPFVGALVYMIVRPPEYLEDIRERELEMQAAEARLHSAGVTACPHCGAETERDYLRCPSCMKRVREPCASCRRPLESGWKMCPYCEAEVGSAERPQRRPSRRRRPSEPAASEPAPVPEAPPSA